MYNKLYNKFKRMNIPLWVLTVLCCAFSVVLLVSLVHNSEYQTITYGVSDSLWIVQLTACILGIIAALFTSFIGIEKISKLYLPIFIISCIGVMLTFTSLGVSRDDDVAWLNIAGFSLQPSELLKLGFIISFAVHISKVKEHFNKPITVILLLAHAMIPITLVYFQGDMGTLCVFAFIFIVMMISGGLNIKYIIGCIILSPLAVIAGWFLVLNDYQRERIEILFNPDLDPYGVGYQQSCAKSAFSSGGLTGHGLFIGDSTEMTYVSESQNDFIFSYIGQVVGIIGCLAVALVLVAIAVLIIRRGRKSTDIGSSVCSGVFALVTAHTIINIGMNLGFLPVIGIPLPFLSAGGTAMVTMLMAIGLVQSTKTVYN